MSATPALPTLPASWTTWSALTALAVFDRLREQGFAGRDPYDALNATRLRWAVDRNTTTRRLTVQAVKHSPVPLQRLLAVPPAVSAYTLGHGMIACARLHKAGLLHNAATTASWLVTRAVDLATDKYGGLAWGSHFAMETRFGRHPQELPNVVVTAYVAKGLVALAEAGLAEVREQLEEAATFMLEGLPRVSNPAGRLIGYTPETTTPIHNASLLAAGVLSDMSVLLERADLALEAESAALHTVYSQRADGSWPYAEGNHGQWVDSFHTGFVLEGLARVRRVTKTATIDSALDRGMAFYRDRLFGEGGEPFYSTARRYPLDALSAAQAVETLAITLDRDEGNLITLRRVLRWLDAAMVRADGTVAYQVRPRWTDWRQFPRWSLAPMASALAGLSGTPSEPAAGAPADSESDAARPGPGNLDSDRRLLMVVHSEYPIGETRVRRQAEAAVAAGWSVDVFALATQGRPRQEVLAGVRVSRSLVRRLRDMSARGLATEYGRFCLDALLFCLTSPDYGVVVVANPPDFLVFSAYPQRLRGARVVLDIHDLMTDLFAVRIAGGSSGMRMRLLRAVERYSIRWANDVMTVHEPYAAEIRRRVGGKTAPTVVMNTADEALFPHRPTAPTGPKVIVYHGSVFERYGVLDLLEAFLRASEASPDVRLWVFGDGDARELLEQRIKASGAAGRIELSAGFLPAETVAQRLACAHIGVVPNQPNELNRYALSTKLFEYVAVGVPVVCAGLPTIREYFCDDELLFFEPGDVDDLSAKLVWAVSHYDDMIEKAANASVRYERHYAWRLQKRFFLDAIAADGSSPTEKEPAHARPIR